MSYKLYAVISDNYMRHSDIVEKIKNILQWEEFTNIRGKKSICVTLSDLEEETKLFKEVGYNPYHTGYKSTNREHAIHTYNVDIVKNLMDKKAADERRKEEKEKELAVLKQYLENKEEFEKYSD